MESSRGGPLTTFIVMLPFIVASFAMLKPAGKDGNILSEWLAAATSSDEAPTSADEIAESVFAEVPESDLGMGFSDESLQGGISDFDSLFEEAAGMAPDSNPVTAESSSAFVSNQVTNGSFPPSSTTPQTDVLMRELKQLGSTRTLWFNPGQGMFGFVAFFQAGNGIMSYRFESIASTQSAAIQDVIAQARSWRTASGQ